MSDLDGCPGAFRIIFSAQSKHDGSTIRAELDRIRQQIGNHQFDSLSVPLTNERRGVDMQVDLMIGTDSAMSFYLGLCYRDEIGLGRIERNCLVRLEPTNLQ